MAFCDDPNCEHCGGPECFYCHNNGVMPNGVECPLGCSVPKPKPIDPKPVRMEGEFAVYRTDTI